jgi:predicted nucleotidyltransferase
MKNIAIDIPQDRLVEFCRRHHIRKLAFFGSVLRDDFRVDSDVDVLVEFSAGQVPGFIRLAGIELELSGLLGRRADLNTPQCFSQPLRARVEAEAEVRYAAA